MTRTVVVGKATPRIRKVYEAVLEARDNAVRAVRPGIRVSTVDGVARRALAKHGLDRFFNHSLGHGVGLSIHERPRISPLSSESLQEGNVVTIEPGVYLPGLGGVRIEDLILVTKKGCEVLNHVSRNLTVI
jgi:Xaa-Pro aminopeptidase